MTSIRLSPQDNSKWRRHYLNSLYEYMQGCNKELAFLVDEQDKIRKQDWSDRMVDPPDIRRQYEVRTFQPKLTDDVPLNVLLTRRWLSSKGGHSNPHLKKVNHE